jgi:YVTN family beta-propeller protein
VVDLFTFSTQNPIPLGASPTAIVPGPHASYALTPRSGSVHAINNDDLRVVCSRKLADELSEIRLAAGGKRLFVISTASRELIEVETDTLRALHRYRLPTEPMGLDIAPAGDYAAVSLRNRGIELIHWPSGRRVKAELPRPVGEVRFRRDGQVLLAACAEEPVLTALTVPDLQIMVDLPLGMVPENLCFTPDGGQLFISGKGMDAVAIVFPYQTIEVDQTILAGPDPGVMACASRPLYLFVGSASASDVSIVDVDTRKVIALVNVGATPTFLTITPDNQYALVLDKRSGNMAVIRIPSIRLAAHWQNAKSGASLFTIIPAGDQPVHAAIVPRRL